MAHTPKPWKWSNAFSSEPRIRNLQPPPHYGTILIATEVKINQQWVGMISEDNARLIESSPALLDACIQALEEAESPDFDGGVSNATRKLLREVIAKALGK